MRAAIFNPYLDTLGGGERYTLSFAKILIDQGYSVDLEWNDESIVKKLETRFGLSLKDLKVVSDIKRGDGYDLCFWVSDGSVPSLLARKNILHFQVPFHGVNGKSLINKMKLFRVSSIVCNSNFTKQVVDSEYGVKSLVIYPPVDTVSIKPKRKENIIINVGRFSSLLQSKHQDVLVESFKEIFDHGQTDWKLILVGGTEVGDSDYTEKLSNMSVGYPVEIIKSPDFKYIKDLYGKSKIFWSASGFGVDEENNPKLVEHFGITVVEAMAAGCVPVICNAGGHKEIVEDGKNGFLWTSKTDLIEATEKLTTNKKLLRQMSQFDISDSSKFSNDKFKSEFEKLL